MVIDTFANLAEKQYLDKKRVLAQIIKILHYRAKDMPSDIRHRWEQLKEALTGTGFSSLVKRYVGMVLLEDELDDEGKRYTSYLSDPVCPYCGVDYQYSEIDGRYEGSGILTCGLWDGDGETPPDARGCGAKFRATPHPTVEWSTEAIDPGPPGPEAP